MSLSSPIHLHRLHPLRPLLRTNTRRACTRVHPRRHISSLISCETIYDPTPEFLVSHFARFASQHGSTSTQSVHSSRQNQQDQDHQQQHLQSVAAIYLISSPSPHPSLPAILTALRSALPDAVGAFSACPPASSFPASGTDTAAAVAVDAANRGGTGITLSIARFLGAKTWYDPQRGRQPISVGRWRRPGEEQDVEDRKGDEVGELGVGRGGQGSGSGLGERGWDEVWEPDRGVERIRDLVGVETRLYHVTQVDTAITIITTIDLLQSTHKHAHRTSTSNLLLLSAGAPRPTLKSLDSMFPHARKAGLISAPTPFLTGRPYTLFHRDRIYAHGTVGLALGGVDGVSPLGGKSGKNGTIGWRESIDFGLEHLSEVMEVDAAQGNMLLSLIGAPNPTQHLISALQARTRSRNLAHTAGGVSTSSNPTTSSTVALGKDEDFYLALINEQTAASGSERTATATSTEVGPGPGIGAGREVVRLLSGDPSRGALSLDMEDSLRVGQRVQFMQRRPTAPLSAPTDQTLTFMAVPKNDQDEVDADSGQSGQTEPRVVPGFIGLSEGGFLHTNARTAVCTSPGAVLKLA